MRTSIWVENKKFIQKHHIYAPEYFQFVWSFLTLAQQDPATFVPSESESLKMIEFTTNFFFDIFGRADTRSNFDRWANHLNSIYAHNKVAAQWLVRSVCTRTREYSRLFTECPSPRVRETFAQIMGKIFVLLAPEERQYYLEEHQSLQGKNLTDRFNRKHKPVSYVIWLFDTLMYLLTTNGLSRSSSSTAEFFLVLLNFAQLGSIELEWVIRENLVSILVDYFLEQGIFTPAFSASSGSAAGGHPKSLMDAPFLMSITPSSHLNYLIELIEYIVLRCRPRRADDKQPPTLILQEDGRAFQLAAIDEAKLIAASSSALWERSIGTRVHPAAISRMLSFLAWESRPNSQFFINAIRTGMSKSGNIMPFLNAMAVVQDVSDSLQPWRVDFSMIKSAVVVKDKAFNNDIRKSLRKWWSDRISENPHVRNWADANDKWVVSELLEAFQHVEPPIQTMHGIAGGRSNISARVFSAVSGPRR